MILETEINEFFKRKFFLIEGFSTYYRLVRHTKGGGIILHVRADMPSNLLAFEDKPIQSLFIELNLQNTKILINLSYSPHKSEIKKHFTAFRNSLDLHSSKYEKILILGDFSVKIEEANLKSFCESYDLKSLIKQPNCYRNPNKSTCIDLTLTNILRMFQSTCVLDTGLSGFHLMIMTVMRKTFRKMRSRVINYRSYRYFSNETFRVSLTNNLLNKVFF